MSENTQILVEKLRNFYDDTVDFCLKKAQDVNDHLELIYHDFCTKDLDLNADPSQIDYQKLYEDIKAFTVKKGEIEKLWDDYKFDLNSKKDEFETNLKIVAELGDNVELIKKEVVDLVSKLEKLPCPYSKEVRGLICFNNDDETWIKDYYTVEFKPSMIAISDVYPYRIKSVLTNIQKVFKIMFNENPSAIPSINNAFKEIKFDEKDQNDQSKSLIYVDILKTARRSAL